MNEARVNAVAILDAIPEGEFNTARRLRDDLEAISATLGLGVTIRYFKVKTLPDLEIAMQKLLDETRDGNRLPMLHFEGHGLNDESGVLLGEGDPCDWSVLKELITPLNVSMRLGLMVVFASCYGGSFARAIRTTDRAPLWGLVGPREQVTAGDIESNFAAFYREFFLKSSGAAAIAALNISTMPPRYFVTHAEIFFYRVWAGYKREYCSAEALQERAERLRNEAIQKNAPRIPTTEELKLQITVREPGFFEKYAETYFMFDLYTENRDRFPVTYAEAESHAAR
jgi:hypothetical protein